MADSDDTELPGNVRLALIIIIGCIFIMAGLTLLDMQLKRAMVDTATQFRMEVERARGSKRAGPAPAPGVPGAVPGVHGVGGVGADGAGAQEDGTAVEAPPLVRPGDESARPPHRGSVDGD